MVHTLNQTGIAFNELDAINLGQKNSACDDRTIACLPFNGDTKDLAGNTWEVHGDPQFVPGPFFGTKAIYFNGSNLSNYMSLPITKEIAQGQLLSFDFWIKIGNTEKNSGIFGISTAAKNSDGDFNLSEKADGNFGYEILSGTTNYNWSVSTPLTVHYDRWCHYSFTINEDNIYVFANGQRAGGSGRTILSFEKREFWIGKTWPQKQDKNPEAIFAHDIAIANFRISDNIRWNRDVVASFVPPRNIYDY